MRSNSTVPTVDIATSINSTSDLHVCTGLGISEFKYCMHFYMTFMPIALMVLLASLFLVYEGTSRAPTAHTSSSNPAADSVPDGQVSATTASPNGSIVDLSPAATVVDMGHDDPDDGGLPAAAFDLQGSSV
jgi:hypothetical protein